VGIPQRKIDALGLDTVPNARAALMTAGGTIRQTPIYIAVGVLEGALFVNGAVPSAVPLVGYKLLQDLGFKVDLVNERIEKRPDDEVGPPFLL
jgi:predicted aspartyl protease